MSADEKKCEFEIRKLPEFGEGYPNVPEPCCGEWETCNKACTFRGIQIGKREAERFQVGNVTLERAFRRGLEAAALEAARNDYLPAVPSNIRALRVPDDLRLAIGKKS